MNGAAAARDRALSWQRPWRPFSPHYLCSSRHIPGNLFSCPPRGLTPAPCSAILLPPLNSCRRSQHPSCSNSQQGMRARVQSLRTIRSPCHVAPHSPASCPLPRSHIATSAVRKQRFHLFCRPLCRHPCWQSRRARLSSDPTTYQLILRSPSACLSCNSCPPCAGSCTLTYDPTASVMAQPHVRPRASVGAAGAERLFAWSTSQASPLAHACLAPQTLKFGTHGSVLLIPGSRSTRFDSMSQAPLRALQNGTKYGI